MGLINPATDMGKSQGLSKILAHEAVVVQNNDGKYHQDRRMLGRIQIRVPGSFDGVEDDLLPWAIPEYGSQSDGASSTSGTFMVSKIGTKVLVYFQDGSPLHPKYCPYIMDEQTALKEREHNYPNRIIHLLQNSALLIIDTQTNEVMIRNPGDTSIYVEGNVYLKVEGNVLEKIEGSRTSQVKGDVIEYVQGNKISYIEGNLSEVIRGDYSKFTGNYSCSVDGTFLETIEGSRSVFTSGADIHSAGGNLIRSAPRIDDNPPAGAGSAPSTTRPNAPDIPTIPKWPVVRGKKPDSTDTEPST